MFQEQYATGSLTIYQKGRVTPKEEWFCSICFFVVASTLPSQRRGWCGREWPAIQVRSLWILLFNQEAEIAITHCLAAWISFEAVLSSKGVKRFWVQSREGLETFLIAALRLLNPRRTTLVQLPLVYARVPSLPSPPNSPVALSILPVPLALTANVLLTNRTA